MENGQVRQDFGTARWCASFTPVTLQDGSVLALLPHKIRACRERIAYQNLHL
ncbi:MAG: hypothetical protein U5R06_00925 [candidate division KSB1 bacterium]|nr:hypothetical protein [candidate division KSB1 bacterium]